MAEKQMTEAGAPIKMIAGFAVCRTKRKERIV